MTFIQMGLALAMASIGQSSAVEASARPQILNVVLVELDPESPETLVVSDWDYWAARTGQLLPRLESALGYRRSHSGATTDRSLFCVTSSAPSFHALSRMTALSTFLDEIAVKTGRPSFLFVRLKREGRSYLGIQGGPSQARVALEFLRHLDDGLKSSGALSTGIGRSSLPPCVFSFDENRLRATASMTPNDVERLVHYLAVAEFQSLLLSAREFSGPLGTAQIEVIWKSLQSDPSLGNINRFVSSLRSVPVGIRQTFVSRLSREGQRNPAWAQSVGRNLNRGLVASTSRGSRGQTRFLSKGFGEWARNKGKVIIGTLGIIGGLVFGEGPIEKWDWPDIPEQIQTEETKEEQPKEENPKEENPKEENPEEENPEEEDPEEEDPKEEPQEGDTGTESQDDKSKANKRIALSRDAIEEILGYPIDGYPTDDPELTHFGWLFPPIAPPVILPRTLHSRPPGGVMLAPEMEITVGNEGVQRTVKEAVAAVQGGRYGGEVNVQGRKAFAVRAPGSGRLFKVSLGWFRLDDLDLQMSAGDGVTVSLERYYSTSSSEVSSELGGGWSFLPYSLILKSPRRPVLLDHRTDQRVSYRRDSQSGQYYARSMSSDVTLRKHDTGEFIATLAYGAEVAFDTSGRLAWTKQPSQDRVNYSFDESGRLRTISSENGAASIALSYGDRIVGRTRSGENVEYALNASGLLKSVHSSSGLRSYRYDSLGRLNVLESNAGHMIVENTYDNRGRMLTHRTPSDSVSFEYDDANGRISVRDASGHITTCFYDGHERLIAYGSAPEKMTIFNYDLIGRIVQVALGHLISDPSKGLRPRFKIIRVLAPEYENASKG